MTTLAARTVSPFAARLLAGPLRDGTVLGHGYIAFGDDVLAVTPPGALRLPNGIEAAVALRTGATATIGEGALCAGQPAIVAGPIWNARPSPRFQVRARPLPQLDLEALVGRGPGLTPLGDDILMGYLGACALAGVPSLPVPGATTALSRTLLRLAALGELPEAAHRLLEDGDLRPLLAFGATSGKGVALGLALINGEAPPHASGRAIALPLDGTMRAFQISLTPIGSSPRSVRGGPPMPRRRRTRTIAARGGSR